MQATLGTVLHFNEGSYINAINKIEELQPLVKELATAYNALGLGDFNQAVYDDLIKRGIENTTTKFLQAAESDLKKFASPLLSKSALGSVDEYLDPLNEIASKVKDAVIAIGVASRPYKPIDHNVLQVNKKGSKYDNEEIKKKFQISFETEKQIQLYKGLSHAAEAMNAAREQIKDSGLPVPMYGIIGSYLQYVDSALTVNTSLFNNMK